MDLSKFVFRPFRPGVGICRLFGDGVEGASAALLKYEPGAAIPRHRHDGVEVIVVLRGSQTDEEGTLAEGDLRLNRPSTEHTVRSDEGCIAFVVWQRPVIFDPM